MSDIPTPYDGPERRRQQIIDDAKLEAAMEEVRKLHGRTTELANAVSRTVPKEEALARERQFKWILVALAFASLVCLLMIPLFVKSLVDGRFDHLDDGQQITHCLATKAEVERTGSLADPALIACEQKATR